MYWHLVDEQYCFSFRCTAKWFRDTRICSFQILFPFSLLQNIEQSCLCCTVGPCWSSVLNIVVCNLVLRVPPVSIPSVLFDYQDFFVVLGFPGVSVVRNLPDNAGGTGDKGSVSESGRPPGVGSQYFYLENSMDRGVWWATVQEVTRWTWLNTLFWLLFMPVMCIFLKLFCHLF